MAIVISLGDEAGQVSDNIYGQFIEHALDCIEGGIYDPQNKYADDNGIRRDVIEEVKKIAPSVIRFPGGTIVSQYHWEDAVGPKEERIWRKNLIWGGELDPGFGTGEFVELCRCVGAEPMLCVNMVCGTAEEAGNWVEYCNGTGGSYYAQLRRKHGHEEPFGVKYWCIGNESYSKPDMGIHHDVKNYIRDAMEFIKRMKLTDDSIKTVIVGSDDREWNLEVLKALHEVTDYFSVHYYASTKNGRLYEPFEGEEKFRKTMEMIAELLGTYPEKVRNFDPWYRFSPRESKIQIAVDEWNIWNFEKNEMYGLKPVYCWRDALWCASMLNLFIRMPAVGMANMAQMVNILAPIMADKNETWMQTIAYPLIYYRRYMSGNRMQLRFCSPQIREAQDIKALSIAAVCQDGRICIAVVNRDFAQSSKLRLADMDDQTMNVADMLVLSGSEPDATCTKTENCVKERTIQITGNEIVIPAGSICMIFAEKKK